MSFAEAVGRLAGRAGGLVAYYAGKLAMHGLNAGKPRRPLSEGTARRLEWLFPGVDLSRVVVIEEARLVARSLERPARTAGMTFGRAVYLARPYSERTHEGLLLLAHELGHVRQIQALGEAAFARRYGEEWLLHGYARMPLEREAEGHRRALRDRLERDRLEGGAGEAS